MVKIAVPLLGLAIVAAFIFGIALAALVSGTDDNTTNFVTVVPSNLMTVDDIGSGWKDPCVAKPAGSGQLLWRFTDGSHVVASGLCAATTVEVTTTG